MRVTALVAAASSILAACSSPSANSPQGEESGGLRRGEPAAGISDDLEQSLTREAGSQSEASQQTGSPGTPREFRQIASLKDPSGDAKGGPSFADFTALTLHDDGTSLRVAVAFGGELPGRLAEAETVGVGVDFFLKAKQESDYQLFAEGGGEGWFGYLQTPSGFVDFPGAFRVGGSFLVFEVPWKSLGSMKAADFKAFADWSKPGPLVLRSASNDLAPDSGSRSFLR